jgi:dTDP-4-amino-4,6-dideoxygalactose transaminase
MYCIRTRERDALVAALGEAQIGFASYYQPPLHLQPALRYLGYSEGDLPETEKAARENLCLPMWGGITEEQQAEVVSVLRRASSLVKA